MKSWAFLAKMFVSAVCVHDSVSVCVHIYT